MDTLSACFASPCGRVESGEGIGGKKKWIPFLPASPVPVEWLNLEKVLAAKKKWIPGVRSR
jgi:hypothetical protein